MGQGEGRFVAIPPHGEAECSPWGQPSKGYRTRKKKPSDNFIVRRRYQ